MRFSLALFLVASSAAPAEAFQAEFAAVLGSPWVIDADASVAAYRTGYSTISRETATFAVTLPPIPLLGLDPVIPRALSADGSVLLASFGPFRRPYLYSDTLGWRDIAGPTFPGSQDGGAAAVSAAGNAAIGNTDNFGSSTGWVWIEGLGLSINAWGAGSWEQVRAISADGTWVVGGMEGQDGYRWSLATGFEHLTFFPASVSADGETIAGTRPQATGNFGEAVRRTPGGAVSLLGSLPNSVGQWVAAADASGDVIVGRSWTAASEQTAWIWTAAQGTRSVLDELNALGAAIPAGWELTSVTISSDGRVLRGFGTNPQGSVSAWYATRWPLGETSVGQSFCSPATSNSTGAAGSLGALGEVIATLDELTLRAEGLPPNQFGYFLASLTAGTVPSSVGQGGLCLTGSIGRYVGPGQVASSGAAGRLELGLELTATPQPTGAVAAVAGETWNFQCWYRDVNPQPTSNLTSAVRVELR